MELTRAEDVIEQLTLLDMLCESKGEHAELVMIGGAAILLLMEHHNEEFRPTRDIDANIIRASDEKQIARILQQANIHVVGGVMELPPPEELLDGTKHKVEYDFTNIDVYVPSFEMLACTKIFSKRPKDLEDLKRSKLLDKCDIKLLLEMVEDYKAFMRNPEDRDINVFDLEEILKQKGSSLVSTRI